MPLKYCDVAISKVPFVEPISYLFEKKILRCQTCDYFIQKNNVGYEFNVFSAVSCLILSEHVYTFCSYLNTTDQDNLNTRTYTIMHAETYQ